MAPVYIVNSLYLAHLLGNHPFFLPTLPITLLQPALYSAPLPIPPNQCHRVATASTSIPFSIPKNLFGNLFYVLAKGFSTFNAIT
jgi:hypothetical protein